MKSRKIAISGPILRLYQNDALKQNSPHGPAVRRLLAVEMHSHASRSSLSSVFSEQIPKITNHNSQNTLSFHNSQNTRLILTNP